MAKKSITLHEDSLKRITKSNAVMALSELVWNSLDADATRVNVVISGDLLSEYIEVSDNGVGIKYSKAETYFSRLGGSWKAQQQKTASNRVMHGEKGEGRFKSFSLGRSVIWSTIYDDDGVKKSYSISQSLNDIKAISLSDVLAEDTKKTGTRVRIEDFLENTMKSTGLGSSNNVIEKLTIIFAPYLIAHNDVEIIVNEEILDPTTLMSDGPIEINIEIGDKKANLRLFLWKNTKDSQIYLCKNSALLCPYTGTLSKKIKTFGQEYSAYLSSDLFNENTVNIADIDTSINDLIEEAINKMNEIFQQKENDKKQLIRDKWIEDKIYPFEVKSVDHLSPTETVKREVFDIVAVQVQEKIKKFEKSDSDSKKLTFRLLAQAIEENPKAIEKILTEVLNLNDEEKEMFANLLNKMELSSIIQSAKVVADRLEFISGLEALIYDNKKELREVDQLHKILENEIWLFNENFTLSVSDQDLTKVLTEHLKISGKKYDDVDTTDIKGNSKNRTDLVLSKTIQIKEGYREHLVVELKRPTQKINYEIIGQIQKYARAIANSERFDKAKTKWVFMAISNEIHDDALDNIEDNRVLRNSKKDNIDVYVYTWAEIINNAKARLNFINKELQYIANDEMARKYLTEKHEQFLPPTYLNQEK